MRFMGHYGTAHWQPCYFYKPWQPQPMDATDEIWTQSAQWIQRRYRFECVDARQQTTTDNWPSYKLPRSLQLWLAKKTKPVTANMVNISIKSQPHTAYGFWDDFFFFFFLHFAFCFLSQPIKMSSRPKIMADRTLLKEHFYESFVKISWKAWQ